MCVALGCRRSLPSESYVWAVEKCDFRQWAAPPPPSEFLEFLRGDVRAVTLSLTPSPHLPL
eukprot:808136-Pyramimonas_sp.AAC.1